MFRYFPVVISTAFVSLQAAAGIQPFPASLSVMEVVVGDATYHVRVGG